MLTMKTGQILEQQKLNKKKEYSWVKYIRERVHEKNKNFISVITGPTGSGKSWGALSIAEMVDEEFNETRVIFRAKDLMKLINSGDLKTGSVIIWDEAGIDLSNRNWQSSLNKVMNFLLQTFRHKNFILLFTVPYGDFIDVASRKLIHAEFETSGINKNKQTCSMKCKLLQYNSSNKKWYRKYLKVRKGGYGIRKIKTWAIPKPSKEIIKKYEAMKEVFTKSLNEEIEGSLSEFNLSGKDVKIKYNHRDVYIIWHLFSKRNKDISEIIGVTTGATSSLFKSMDKLYPTWRGDEKLLGDLDNLDNLKILSPSKLKFWERAKKITGVDPKTKEND